jgi:hypothetical protein
VGSGIRKILSRTPSVNALALRRLRLLGGGAKRIRPKANWSGQA